MNRKRQLVMLLSLLTGSILLSSEAHAQEAHHPQISIAHRGIDFLKADIKLLLELATKEKNHWENWEGVIDLFAWGLDYTRPVRIDILSGLAPAPMMIFGPSNAPITELLEENLEGAEFVPKKIAENFYELLPPEQGWFRVLPKAKYAILILSTELNHNLLKQLILKATDPTKVIELVLSGGASVGVQLANEAHGADDQKKRRDSFADIRDNRMAALQKRPKESQSEFELRKGLLAVNLDELERLLVESKLAKAQAFLNSAGPVASIKFEAVGIADTSFAKGIAAIGKKKDAFASIVKPKETALSMRINHPIDELRQKNSLKIIELLDADVKSQLAAKDNSMSADEKKATQELFDGIALLFKDGIATGNLNAYLESVPNDDRKFVTHGAVAAVDAKRLDKTLALVSKTGKGNEVETEIETVNGVAIHRLKLRKGFLKIFDKVFGENAEVYIGTSETAVWFGAGPDSLESLKASIESLKEPADSDVILTIDAELMHWARRANEIAKDLPEPESLDDKEARRDLLLRLKHATESLKEGDDDIHFEMSVEDDTATGVIKVNTGTLRFIGSQLKTFSENSLQ